MAGFKRKRTRAILAAAWSGAWVALAGCGAAVKPAAHVDEKLNFHLFDNAVADHRLPWVLRDNSSQDAPCFKTGETLFSAEDTAEVLQILESNRPYIHDLIGRWYVESGPLGAESEAILDGTAVSGVESLTVVKLPLRSLRFDEAQACIQEETAALQPGLQVVATLFGARVFHFSSARPLSDGHLKRMRKAANKAGVALEYEEPPVYRPIYIRKGKQKTDKKGEKLFRGPDGSVVTEKALPPPEAMQVKSWTIRAARPVFFGFRALSGMAWQTLEQADECSVYLIWNDAVPRPSECDFFESAGFSIKNNEIRRRPKHRIHTEEGEVAVRVTTEAKERDAVAVYGRKTMIQAGDRLVVWVEPVEAPEGAILKLRGLRLNPGPNGAQGDRIAADGSIMGDPVEPTSPAEP